MNTQYKETNTNIVHLFLFVFYQVADMYLPIFKIVHTKKTIKNGRFFSFVQH